MVLETYYRKRSKKSHQPNLPEMNQSCQKEPENMIAGQSLVLARHHHGPPHPSSDFCSQLFNESAYGGDKSQMEDHIEVGRLYEIHHIHLPPRTPVQLRSIRVAMVVEKTDVNVSVRYPSMQSLRAFFCYTKRQTHPALDEKFVMGTELAAMALSRVVPAEIYSEQKSLESFWVMTSSPDVDSFEGNDGVGKNKKGECLSALKTNGMMRWGIRKQVKYLGRHKEIDDVDIHGQNSSSSFVDGVEAQMESEAVLDEDKSEEETKEEEDRDEDDDDGAKNRERGLREDEDMEEEDGDYQETEEEEEEEEREQKKKWITKVSDKNILKRKRYPTRNTGKKKPKTQNVEAKKQKQQQTKKIQPKKTKRTKFKEALILRNPKDRWSSERYKLAEQNLLEVMKSKGATANKPILRPQLRAEARKFIGDTGLLDHLLKHMAGKLAPGGEERFRRRHNADGAMEYWLENADLVTIRKEAGISDPYWVPPPGWKPGDSPTQDPICARELKLVKEENLRMKGCYEELKASVEKLRREIAEICHTDKGQDQNHAITNALVPSGLSQKMDQIASLVSSTEKEKFKELLMAVLYDFAKGIEEKFSRKAVNLEDQGLSMGDSTLIVATETSFGNKEKKQELEEAQSKQQQVQAFNATGQKIQELVKDDQKYRPNAAESLALAEAKAAKIQRLKSGFRICKPQGTFLWPNMAKNTNSNSASNKMAPPHPHQVMVQVEVPTPPSVSSSAPPQLPYHLHHPQYLHPPPSSPVKPLAERRAVTVTVSTVNKGQSFEDGSNNYSTTTATINLNESPNNPSPTPLQSFAANYTTPWENATYHGKRNALGYDERQDNNRCCSSSGSSLASEVGNWLALSTLKSASDESSHG